MLRKHQRFGAVCLVALLGFSLAQAQPTQGKRPNLNDPYGLGGDSNVYSTQKPSLDNPYFSDVEIPPLPQQSDGLGGAGGLAALAVLGNGGYGGGGGFYPPWSPWSRWNNGYNPTAGQMIGLSTMIDAQGQYILDQEYARIYRQQRDRLRLRRIKEEFDLVRYIKANTPSFTEEQVKIAAERLERIRKVASPGEIISGRALNILIQGMGQLPLDQVAPSGSVKLDGNLLTRLNVRAPAAAGNLGLLRNGGELDWPPSVYKLATPEQLKDINVQVQELVRQAEDGEKINPNVLQDLEANVAELREQLSRRFEEIGGGAYLEASRFLTQLEEAVRGLRSNSMARQYFGFQKEVQNGKNAADVVQYMLRNGLEFAPATEGDAAAYQALYNALVNLDLAVNTQLAVRPKQ